MSYDRITNEVIKAVDDLEGRARFNEIKSQIDRRRKKRKISTETLSRKLNSLVQIRALRHGDEIVHGKKVSFYYKGSYFDKTLALGYVISSLSNLFNILGISRKQPFHGLITTAPKMTREDFKGVLKILKALEERSKKAREYVEFYLNQI